MIPPVMPRSMLSTAEVRARWRTPGDGGSGPVWCPFDLTVESVARLLNGELVDHPVYTGFELQWFDDSAHGTGMLAFLQRRDDRRVDYYVEPGLELDRAGYEIGGGTGRWVPTTFEVAHLAVDVDGVDAEVRFLDVDGRPIEIRVDDRAAGRRRPADLLAPVGSSIEHPASLLLVFMHGFDLLRRGGPDPVVRIDGQQVVIGALPVAFLHRRHLIKAAAPMSVATVCRATTGALAAVDPAAPRGVRLDANRAIREVTVGDDEVTASLQFVPAFPELTRLVEDVAATGAWRVTIDQVTITGGTWHAVRRGERIDLSLEVTRGWRPAPGLPLLMRIVTRVMPVFRRWPTTYRWRAEISLDDPPRIASRWERTTTDLGESYRRATQSGSRRPSGRRHQPAGGRDIGRGAP
jgi:hypothetical protein